MSELMAEGACARVAWGLNCVWHTSRPPTQELREGAEVLRRQGQLLGVDRGERAQEPPREHLISVVQVQGLLDQGLCKLPRPTDFHAPREYARHGSLRQGRDFVPGLLAERGVRRDGLGQQTVTLVARQISYVDVSLTHDIVDSGHVQDGV